MAARRRRSSDGEGPLSAADVDAFVTAYLAEYEALYRGTRNERLDSGDDPFASPSWRIDEPIMFGDPVALEESWQLLLALIERAPDEETLAFVAAGPLEDIVTKRHEQFGDRILAAMRQDAQFRHAMHGVWGLERLPQPFQGRLIGLMESAPPPTVQEGRVARGRRRPR